MFKAIARLLSPDRCVLCNTEGTGVCQDCREFALSERTSSCYVCNAVTPEGRICSRCQWRTPVRRCHVLWRLDTPGETLVYGLKYDGREDIARSVARVLQQQNLPYFDLITFVPDTAARQRERGFVPAQLIARELSRVSGKPYIELLDRIEHTPQVGAGRTQRWQQVRGNFRAKHTELAYDKRILLIDDVVTTGATITECAKTLKSAGTGPIYVAALAKK